MLDFFTVSTRTDKRTGTVDIYPSFHIGKSNDLMIRGADFYAIWVEDRGMWSTDEEDVIRLIDRELYKKFDELKASYPDRDYNVLTMRSAESGVIDRWHRYCQKQLRDSFVMLDEKLIFSDTDTNKKDYSSKRLSYPLKAGDISAWNKLIGTLYSEEERHKIEWAIGAIISGDSKEIQKFMVLYGEQGAGKSTIMNVMQLLFDGYYAVFDAKALGSSSNAFALEAFKTNPLVAIQHDGDLSRIEDNTRINSLVSHEWMSVNEKFRPSYPNRFKAFLIMGTNKPVRITDAKSGLIRRLIDVTPSGNKLPIAEYRKVVRQVNFELGAIAYHCLEVYKSDPGRYDNYIPKSMLGASNDFYNYVLDSYHVFKREDGTTLKAAWEMYKTYCDDAKVPYPMSRRNFQEELKNYFRDYNERFNMEDGSRVRSYYTGFRTEKFEREEGGYEPDCATNVAPIVFVACERPSENVLNVVCAGDYAQYATDQGTPMQKWDSVRTTLRDLDTSLLHYLKPPENHIVIDFDIPGPDGEKSLERNMEAASKWPATYAELSKSGKGVHLHYIYTGDVSKLSRIYAEHIEVKVFTGKSSLRRMLTKCNNLPIATISSGLPLKGEDKLVDFEGVKNEKMLRSMIHKNLNKEYHGATKPSVDYIYALLEDAYDRGIGYDVSDLKNAVYAFAVNSTNQADYCIGLVTKMKFKSDDPNAPVTNKSDELVFCDVEVFPNLFLVNWKFAGEGKPVVRMINPTPSEIEELMKFNLVGFNCRRYDNHILYGCLIGYNNEQLYNLSQKIIGGERNAFFGEAYNISYTDVYDFAATKQSLKKWEIELGIHHQELGLPWDQPVPESRWIEVAEYCDNDVIATEAVFNHLKADFTARKILADVAGMTVNDTTNTLTTRIIFGSNRAPQNQFNYRDMGDSGQVSEGVTVRYTDCIGDFDDYTVFDSQGRPVFPGYKYEMGKSTYRGEEVGEGGYVFAVPGMYGNVALLDVASMHPASIIAEQLFGPEFTKRFQELRDARVAIKHKDFEAAKKMLNGVLVKYLDDPAVAKDLAQALKIAINSVYGLTAAKFAHAFKDPRNKDNIVAKRGALFMVNLKHEVHKRGFVVAHIKTDSIKIPDATPEIIQFVMEYGKMYGYTFEHEATYDRMCLVNDAVYIARYRNDDGSLGDWTATGTQFQVPYVYKKLFTHEDIVFEDLCETKSVQSPSAIYLDHNENLPENEHDLHFVGRVGSFCPIKPGCGGAELVRQATDGDGNVKYDAVTGTKGYRWLEAEMVENSRSMNDVDLSYYDNLVDAAVYGRGKKGTKQYRPGISDFGDFEWFVSDDPYIGPLYDTDGRPVYYPEDDVPWDESTVPFDVR